MAGWPGGGFGQNFVRALIGNTEGQNAPDNPVYVEQTEAPPLPAGGTPVADTTPLTTNPVPLGSQPCVAVLVQADPDNTPDVLIGDASSQPYQLTPGQAVSLPVSDVGLLFAKTVSGTGAVNWIAVTQ